VILVNPSGNIISQYDQFGATGSVELTAFHSIIDNLAIDCASDRAVQALRE
jgi:hypothetical protein